MPFSWFSRRKPKQLERQAKAAPVKPVAKPEPATPPPAKLATRKRSSSVTAELKLLSLNIGGQLGDDARAKLDAVRFSLDEGVKALSLLGDAREDSQVNEQVLADLVGKLRPELGVSGYSGCASFGDIKWVLRRVTIPEWYGEFVVAEQLAGYPMTAYDTCLRSKPIASYLEAVLDLDVDRSLGWWVVGGEGRTWQELYDAWLSAAQAVEHISVARKRHRGAHVDVYPPLPTRELRPALHIIVEERGKPLDMLQAALRDPALAGLGTNPTSILGERSRQALGLADGPMYRPFSSPSAATPSSSAPTRLPRSTSASSNIAPVDPSWTEFEQSGFGDIAPEAKPGSLSLDARGTIELDDAFVSFFDDVASDPSVTALWPGFAVFELSEKSTATAGAELLLVTTAGRSPPASISSRSPNVRKDSFKRPNGRRNSLFGTLARSPSTLFGQRQGITEGSEVNELGVPKPAEDASSTRAVYVPTPTDNRSLAALSVDSHDKASEADHRRERSLAPSPSPRPTALALDPPLDLPTPSTYISYNSIDSPSILTPETENATELMSRSPRSDGTFGQ